MGHAVGDFGCVHQSLRLHTTADDEMRVLSYTSTGIEYSAWTGAYSSKAITDLAQQYCQRESKTAQIIGSETAEKNIFKGSRVVYRFNCVG